MVHYQVILILRLDINVDPSNPSYVIMSGGYTPNSNFEDDIGIFEYIREECFGADSFVYPIFNLIMSMMIMVVGLKKQLWSFVYMILDQPIVVLPYNNGNIENIILIHLMKMRN